jgi:hypothetical protein
MKRFVVNVFLHAGGIFELGQTQTQTAFKYGLAVRNGPEEQRRNGDVEFQAFVSVINTADTFKLSRTGNNSKESVDQ